MKLTHCDLFFADGAVLVEGNVERLLLPLMIEKSAAELRSNYLSILELGGSFSHKFKPLIHFLGLTTLIITDLDSVFPRAANPTTGGSDDHLSVDVADEGCDEAEESDGRSRKTCMTIEPTAVTSNQTLATWLPRMKAVADLLNATAASKSPVPTATAPARVCVAYQTRQTVKWNGETKEMAGRTFEEAFAYENLEWCQDVEQKSLHLRVQKKATTLTLDEITQKIHDRVKSDGFDKTDFALCLMMADRDQWKVPNYIAVGLEWLAQHLAANSAEPVAVVGTSGEEPGA